MIRSRDGFTALCTLYPSLNDVWINHVVPFLLSSREDVESQMFLGLFALEMIQIVSTIHDRCLPSNPKWKAWRTWYIHPSVVFLCSTVITGQETHFIYHVNKRRSNCCCCCRMATLDGHVKTRFVRSNQDKVWHNYDGSDILLCNRLENVRQKFSIELSETHLRGLCAHSLHWLLMHAIQHKVHMLKHVKCRIDI
jgi:hypothetical protein